jgi:hypothetical protein
MGDFSRRPPKSIGLTIWETRGPSILGASFRPSARAYISSPAARALGRDDPASGIIQISPSPTRLTRIVFDECHSLETQKDFRPIMLHLPELRGGTIFVPFIFLSTTLSPSRETQLKQTFGCPNARTIRTQCNRPNISYTVKLISTEARYPQKHDRTHLSIPNYRQSGSWYYILPDNLSCRRYRRISHDHRGQICLSYTGKMTDA